MKGIYLDHASTTPVRPEVMEAMRPLLTEGYGNPSSMHRWGRQARALLEDARDQVAAAMGAHRREIVFTSGGTEADNLAVLGGARTLGCQGLRVVISAIEHKAVIGPAKQAAREGAELVTVAVDENGIIDLDALDHAMVRGSGTSQAAHLLCAVMWGNNEVGALQPVATIAQRCHAAGVMFHTDAVQALGRVSVRVDEVGCTTLAISGHKIGAPKGVGALFVRNGTVLEALTHGGGQEHELRPGTENVAGIVGLGVAVELAIRDQEHEAVRLASLRDRLESELCALLPGVTVNAGRAGRLPHLLNLSFANVDQEALLVSLDLEGIAVSSGSACQSGSVEPSHVLTAMGRSRANEASIRISLGRTTTENEVAGVARTISRVVERLRSNQLSQAEV